MRVLVVGNSHAGALRLAAGQGAPVVSAFYTIHGGGGPNVEIRDGRIVPLRAGVEVRSTLPGDPAEGVALEIWDAVVLSAPGLPAPRPNFERHLSNRMRLAALAAAESGPPLVSEAVMAAVIGQSLLALPGPRFLRELGQHFSGRILVQPVPLPTPRDLDPDQTHLAVYYGERAAAFMAFCHGAEMSILAGLAAAIGPRAEILPLPDLTWADTGMTPEIYAARATFHMNEAYGRLVLNQVAGRLAAG